jgi:hypothetical protein
MRRFAKARLSETRAAKKLRRTRRAAEQKAMTLGISFPLDSKTIEVAQRKLTLRRVPLM